MKAITISIGVSMLAGLAALSSAQPMPSTQPGPEHEVLKQDVGTWDATVEIFGPGQPPVVHQGVETNALMAGLWLVTDYKSINPAGPPFEGRGMYGYDPKKKKYVSSWVDSMSTSLAMAESSYDAKTKTMSGSSEEPDPSGKTVKMRWTTEYKDGDTRVSTNYMTGPDGKETPTMRISYKRRK